MNKTSDELKYIRNKLNEISDNIEERDSISIKFEFTIIILLIIIVTLVTFIFWNVI